MISETKVVRSTLHHLRFWTTPGNQADLWEFSHFIFLDRQVETWGRKSVVVVLSLCSVLMKQGWHLWIKSPWAFDPYSCCSHGKSCDRFQEKYLSCTHYLYCNPTLLFDFQSMKPIWLLLIGSWSHWRLSQTRLALKKKLSFEHFV